MTLYNLSCLSLPDQYHMEPICLEKINNKTCKKNKNFYVYALYTLNSSILVQFFYIYTIFSQ